MELLIKASLALAIALLFYKLVLQQESFFATNRIYLLACLILAFTLPNIPIPRLVEQQGYISSLIKKAGNPETVLLKPESKEEAVSHSVTILPQFQEEEIVSYRTKEAAEVTSATANPEGDNSVDPYSMAEVGDLSAAQAPSGEIKESKPFNLFFWISALYLFGVGIFSLSLVYQLLCIYLKIKRSKDRIIDGECVIVNTTQRQAPCSFFNYVFVYPDDYDFEAYEQIIAHEKAHVKLGHSFDLLLAEIAVILLWFNPLIWLFRKEIEKNNEYQTDAMLLEKEQVRRDSYQLNLLQIAVPNKPLNITTNYNQSLLKQRIMMMNSKKSTPNAYWKYAFLFPLFFVTLLLLNEPAVSQEIPNSSQSSQEEEKPEIKENNQVKEKEAFKEILREKYVGNNVLSYEEGMVQESVSEEAVREPQPLREPQQEARQLIAGKEALEVTRTSLVNREVISEKIRGTQTDMTKGVWYSTLEDGEYCIQFRGSRDREASNWNMGKCFERGAFTKQGENTFVMTRETGTLKLEGNPDAEVGQGKYTFNEDASFKNFLSGQGISSDDKNLMFHLFFGDVNKAYVNFLKNEFPDLNARNLRDLAIHGVTPEMVKDYNSLYAAHGNKKPTVQDVIAARIHGISKEYVQEIQKAGYSDANLRDLMQARIHGVDAAFIQSLRNSNVGNLSLEEVVQARIHRVDPATIKEMEALGYGELELQEIMQLKIHGVDANYIEQLRSANLHNLSLDQVLQARIHNLDPEAVRNIQKMGYSNLGFDELLTAKIHNVNIAYVEDLRKAGFKNVPMNDLVSAKIHGIDSRFIEEARRNGYDLSSLDKYISLKIHDRAMKSLKNK